MEVLLENSVQPSFDPKNIWKECLKIIKDNLPLITYNTWFIPIKPLSFENKVLKIEVPNNFFIEWIDEHYKVLIDRVIYSVIGEGGKIIYVINKEKEDQLSIFDDEPISQTLINLDKKSGVQKADTNVESNLNPQYTFFNFIKGEGNQLARAAAVAIAENPGITSFNPFFVYGGVGLGKTHLVQAIGNEITRKFPSKKVIYLSTDTFTVEFVDSIQANKVNEFSNFYKSMDVLIIDDIQFLIGKERTQDLFFQIFNILHQSQKQIILTSDKPPKDLNGMSERLISRFQWGLTADVQPPDFETRMAILKNKSASFGIEISSEILEYIAANITSNIRELEGCLIRLLANSSLNSMNITFELAKKTVKEISTGKTTKVNIDFIASVVCEVLGVDENSLREKNRKKEIALARQIAMYLSKKLTNFSLKTIGLHFGGRDHSTVIHAFNSVEKQMKLDDNLRETVNSIKTKIEVMAG
ncbi:MAG: chromosomal replication initiator protein DnaA [Chlorobi bacterium]|nr:chromosomal replication initiator protein DnaA [Chlorobiota bacterium]